MALFEVASGRLVPAQIGRDVSAPLPEDVVESIRSQVLEVIARPLFPITWNELSRTPNPSAEPRLTCLDASGQVVSVEVLQRLTSTTLINALSALADAAAMSWTELASEYPGGIPAFRAQWLNFRDSMPPAPGAGPRLIIVVERIDASARTALEVLTASGVEVHEITLRHMANGRAFLSVAPVGPRVYAHTPQILGQTGAVPAVETPTSGKGSQPEISDEATPAARRLSAAPALNVAADTPQVELVASALEQRESLPLSLAVPHYPRVARHAVPAVKQPSEQLDETPTVAQVEETAVTAPTAPSQPQPELQPLFPAAELPREPRNAGEEPASEQNEPELLQQNFAGLQALAVIVGQEVPLWIRDKRDDMPLLLTANGEIRVWYRNFSDPAEALAYAGRHEPDAWHALRLGGAEGPTLAEALDEVNAEIQRVK